MAATVEPPRTSNTALGYRETLTICPKTVVIENATNGQPPQRIQRGMGRLRPCRLANSESAPSGHRMPHQTRPNNTMENSTKGHQMPQNNQRAKTNKKLHTHT